MTEFYYGSCPWEGLVWKCACDGSDIEIWPFDTLQTNKNIEYIWTIIHDSAGYGGEWRDRILQATIDLEVTILVMYGGLGNILTVSFRQFIKMLNEGVLVAEYTLSNGTSRFTEELSRGQRIKKFLNDAVPYIWEWVHKIKSDQVFDKRMADDHEPKIVRQLEKIRNDDVETFYFDTMQIIKNRDNDLVRNQSHYKMHSGIYYGMCPKEGLLWKYDSNWDTLKIYPWDGAMPSSKMLHSIWIGVEESGRYGRDGVSVTDISNITSNLKVTDITVHTGDGVHTQPAMVRTESFHAFIKDVLSGLQVATFTLPDGTGRYYLQELSQDTRVERFLDDTVPFVYDAVKAKSLCKKYYSRPLPWDVVEYSSLDATIGNASASASGTSKLKALAAAEHKRQDKISEYKDEIKNLHDLLQFPLKHCLCGDAYSDLEAIAAYKTMVKELIGIEL